MNKENPNLDGMDSQGNNQDIPEAPSKEQPVPQGNTPDYARLEKQYKELQEGFRQRSEENKSFKQKFEELNPEIERLKKLKDVFGEQAKEENFWHALPKKYQSQEQTIKELLESREANTTRVDQLERMLAAKEEKAEFESFDAEMKEYFLNPDKDLPLVKQKIVEYIPNAYEQWQRGRTLKSLYAEMMGLESMNPDSTLVKSRQAKEARKTNLKANNKVKSSDGLGLGAGSDEDEIISIVRSQ
jgi:chromosome segregation ATPase